MKKILKAGFFQKIFLPAMLAILLFVISSFVFIIPAFERNAISQKKTMLFELTNTAWSILQKYQTIESDGIISRQEAQEKAIAEIKSLRYGPDQKDYFWITDLTPVMVMHPYVQELNGKNLQNFTDPDGIKIFVEALSIVEEHGEGFMQYKWQFKDDPGHIDPKLSFVKKFSPWNWIIGTGLYLHDVKVEISKLTNRLVFILIGITLIIALIILFIAFQSLAIENKRRAIETQLHESKEKYKSLLESSTEGIILLLNNRISYTNAFIQSWLRYSAEELQEMDVANLLDAAQVPGLGEIKQETRIEIQIQKKDKTFVDAVLTIMPVCFADKEGLLLTFRDTAEYRTTQQELKEIKKRLQIISDHTGIGLFRFSMKGRNKVIDFNRNVVSILGYSNESEFKSLCLEQVLASKDELKQILRALKQNPSLIGLSVRLRRKNNSLIDAKLHLNLTPGNESDHVICNGIIETAPLMVVPDEFYRFSNEFAQILSQNLAPVLEYSSPVVFCHSKATISQSLEILTENKTSLLVINADGKSIGTVSYHDIIFRSLAQNLPLDRPVTDIMTSPLVMVHEQISIEEAAAMMENKGLSHLLIKNNSEEPLALVEKEKLVGVFTNIHREFARMIKNSHGIASLNSLRNKLPFLTKPLLSELGNVKAACKLLTDFNDQITIKIIENALKEIGPAPVPFAFITLGSAGRGELVFNSDQDNALVYEDDPEFSPQTLQQYFLRLGSVICAQLDKSGLTACTGGYMASNPRWCQPLSVWKEYFQEWIVNAEPDNILNISVFFDASFVYGDKGLFHKLEDHIFSMLNGQSAFFYFLAQSVTRFRPPVNVFGNIITESSKKHAEKIDIKNSLAAVIMFVRIYALFHGLRLKNTLQRIDALMTLEVLNQSTASELNFHYNYLMFLRMQAQIDQVNRREPLSNFVEIKKLNGMEQSILKKVFSQINGYEEKLSAEFMSAYKG